MRNIAENITDILLGVKPDMCHVMRDLFVSVKENYPQGLSRAVAYTIFPIYYMSATDSWAQTLLETRVGGVTLNAGILESGGYDKRTLGKAHVAIWDISVSGVDVPELTTHIR